jgi:hypothetical protein
VRSFSHIVIIALGLAAVAVSACNGPSSSFSPAATFSQPSHVAPSATATPSPIPFIFQTVDDPNSNFNAVTGINQLAKVVGVYGGGQSSNVYESYTAQSPYTQFRPLNDPGSQGTYATSLSSNKMDAGFVITPAGKSGIWGFVRFNQLWSLFADPNEGTGNNAVTKIWGINDSQFAVGNYLNSAGVSIPFELDIPTNSYTDLHPPGAVGDAVATGIDGKGNSAGWVTTSKGVVGFFLQAGTYYTFSYPNAKATYALSLNWSDQIVGYYVDQSNAIHGFLLTGPTRGGATQVWQSIDATNATAGTWVTGINNHHVICGYFKDASGIQHGFIALP